MINTSIAYLNSVKDSYNQTR